jgi:NCS1 family nucleobase:cation symporter-1
MDPFVMLNESLQVTEYYVVRKGHYNVKDLYSTGEGSWYWYTYGINFR